MNKVISDYHINSQLLDLIKESEEYLILISPYVTLWGHLEEEIESAILRKVNVHLYFRSDKEEEYFETLYPLKQMGVKLFHIENLHTKLYLSEKKGILSSMNLVDYSSKNSKEIGLITDEKDLLNQYREYSKDLISKAFKSQKSMLRKGLELFEGAVKVSNAVSMLIKDEGVCIRCGEKIPYNPEKPYCKKCFKSWNKFKNIHYKECYCHQCTEDWDTSLDKPVCKECFKDIMETI